MLECRIHRSRVFKKHGIEILRREIYCKAEVCTDERACTFIGLDRIWSHLQFIVSYSFLSSLLLPSIYLSYFSISPFFFTFLPSPFLPYLLTPSLLSLPSFLPSLRPSLPHPSSPSFHPPSLTFPFHLLCCNRNPMEAQIEAVWRQQLGATSTVRYPAWPV